eukprot:1389680-Pyramimonas_sp.AAC.2
MTKQGAKHVTKVVSSCTGIPIDWPMSSEMLEKEFFNRMLKFGSEAMNFRLHSIFRECMQQGPQKGLQIVIGKDYGAFMFIKQGGAEHCDKAPPCDDDNGGRWRRRRRRRRCDGDDDD